MSLPAILEGRLALPVIGSPLFIISNPDLVIAQCKAGIVGSFPALNARPEPALDEWLDRITTELAAYNAAPSATRRSAPFAVNQIVHKSNDRLEQRPRAVREVQGADHHHLARRARGRQPAVHSYGGIVLHDVINNRFAKKAIEKGADGLIAVAAGAGGHAGTPVAVRAGSRRCANGSTARWCCPAPSPTATRSSPRRRWAPTSPISARPSSPPRRPMPPKATSR